MSSMIRTVKKTKASMFSRAIWYTVFCNDIIEDGSGQARVTLYRIAIGAEQSGVIFTP